MRRGVVLALLLALLLAFLCGCGRDASQLTVVTGIGVDGAPGCYQVETEVIRLSGQEQEGESILLQTDGRTVTDGIDGMAAMTGRSLYCNHAQVLIVGRETARQDISAVLEELLHGNQYPVSLRLAVAKETAAQLLQAEPLLGDLRSTELEDTIRQGAQQCLTADMDLCEFYEELLAPGIQGILPFVELREVQGRPACTLTGTALFRDASLLTVLNKEDSRSLLWLRGEQGGTLETSCGLLEVTYLKRTLKTDSDGAVLTLELALTANDSESDRESLIPAAEEAMKTRCRSLLDRLQGLECDSVGIGQQLRRTDRDAWEHLQPWDTAFADYPIRVEVRVQSVIWGRIWDEEGRAYGEDTHGT